VAHGDAVDCRDTAGLLGGVELPGEDEAAVVVQDREQVIPAPADNLEVSEVGLPGIVYLPGGVLESAFRPKAR